MNMLNSLIIEGKITENVVVTEVNTIPNATFNIATERLYKTSDGTTETETLISEVRAHGNLANTLKTYGEKGRSVRIVGRLAQSIYEVDGKKCSKIYILAEHIEFKPSEKKQEKVHGF